MHVQVQGQCQEVLNNKFRAAGKTYPDTSKSLYCTCVCFFILFNLHFNFLEVLICKIKKRRIYYSRRQDALSPLDCMIGK